MKWASALVLVAVMGLGMVAPAQAQRFGIMFGDERSDFFPERISCMNDYEIRNAVRAFGFSQILLNVPDSMHVQVQATKGKWVYLLDFNYCTGQIESHRKLRPAR